MDDEADRIVGKCRVGECELVADEGLDGVESQLLHQDGVGDAVFDVLVDGEGALIGGIAAIPFAFLPATAGVMAFAGVGAASGAAGYVADLAIFGGEFSWGGSAGHCSSKTRGLGCSLLQGG